MSRVVGCLIAARYISKMYNSRVKKNGKQHHIYNDVKRALFRQLRTEEYQATLY